MAPPPPWASIQVPPPTTARTTAAARPIHRGDLDGVGRAAVAMNGRVSGGGIPPLGGARVPPPPSPGPGALGGGAPRAPPGVVRGPPPAALRALATPKSATTA